MGKKRASGEGSIYFDPKRNRWIVQLPADPITGKRPSRSAKTEREALALKRQLEAEQGRGRDLSAKQPTLEDWLGIWLDEIVAPNLKPSTLASYRDITARYLVPMLGRHRLDALTPALCQRWVNTLAKDVRASTVRNAHRRLRAALEVAIDWRYITSNPAARVQLPDLPPAAIHAYTLEETRALLRATEDWRQGAIVLLMLLLGLRRGEALGLAWRDLNWDAATIAITQQVQTIAGKTVISPSPKNDSSRRVLPVPPRALGRLRAHWENQQEERALGGPEWKEHGLIFASGIGTPVLPANLHRALHGEKACDGRAQTKGFMEKAGVPERRIHDLRHTCATLLGEQGEREEVIAALLGHTPATITRHYANVRLDTLRAAVERLERVLLDESEAARDAQ